MPPPDPRQPEARGDRRARGRVCQLRSRMRACYCIDMLDHHVQIILDEGRYQKVAREAARSGASIDVIIREAIDRLASHDEERSAAVAAILAATPMPAPDDPAALRREIDAAHDPAGA